ncbi:MAG: hypothetical protein E7156_03920 [Streptococcus gallolyticus]|jgi:hypothetical protein|uniref:Uncharacterized protein n=1 Tax=Streptococcus gallolyticus TaxID=315405 RepID=A0A928A5F4_9STRE|nr:hypothetical protein [Streptococcus gallolyticus]
MIELGDIIDLIWVEETSIYIITEDDERLEYGENYISSDLLLSTVEEISVYNDGSVEIELGD